MKKILRFLLSRSFIFGLLAAVQIALFTALVVGFSRFGGIAYTLLTILSVLAIVLVFEKENTNPAYKIMWLLLVVAMPVSGAVFYFLWGRNSLSRKNGRMLESIEKNASAALIQDGALCEHLRENDPTLARAAQYLVAQASAPLFTNTQCEYFPWGEDFFARFLEEARKAEKYIFMEYFIIEEGEMWNTTLTLLKEKAAAGVDVRILFDGFGCMFTLPDKYEEQLRRAGIKCQVFSAMHFSWHMSDYTMLNHRDHRKITVIDGEVGFTGGLNFADEYINKASRFGKWKDTGFMLKGPAVYSLCVTFLKMWDFVNASSTQYEEFRPIRHYPGESGFVQPYCDSPLDHETVSENAYFNIIHRAKDYVYIVSPYLIIDHEMVQSLCLAAKGGVDVRIITPGIPDKWYVYYVTQSYYPVLLKAGVRIYEYTPGFIHAKMYVSDDDVAIVGSANMDYRSLYLHFENCCMFYGGHMVTDVKNDIDETLHVSREVTLADTMRVPLHKWLLQLLFRFFAPLM